MNLIKRGTFYMNMVVFLIIFKRGKNKESDMWGGTC